MSKHIAFELDEKLHKEMKMYLFSLEEEKTIKIDVTHRLGMMAHACNPDT